MEMSQLTARRPYLLRAFYDWLLDNQLTPHLVVDINLPGVQVPLEYARDGQIVLVDRLDQIPLHFVSHATHIGSLDIAFRPTAVHSVVRRWKLR